MAKRARKTKQGETGYDNCGRNTKRTTNRVDLLMRGLRAGDTRNCARALAGISKQTFYNWLADPTFLDAVEKAEAVAERRFRRIVAKSAIKDKQWTSAAWWLERRRREDYARIDGLRVDHSGNIGNGDIDATRLSKDELRQVEAILGKAALVSAPEAPPEIPEGSVH